MHMGDCPAPSRGKQVKSPLPSWRTFPFLSFTVAVSATIGGAALSALSISACLSCASAGAAATNTTAAPSTAAEGQGALTALITGEIRVDPKLVSNVFIVMPPHLTNTHPCAF